VIIVQMYSFNLMCDEIIILHTVTPCIHPVQSPRFQVHRQACNTLHSW
jgi:hypothetical protein